MSVIKQIAWSEEIYKYHLLKILTINALEVFCHFKFLEKRSTFVTTNFV